MTTEAFDLGNGYSYTKMQWTCDRDINPQFPIETHPDVPWCGIMLTCPHSKSGLNFIIPGHPLFNHGWVVESWEPLTLSPSIASRSCHCHGYVREGKWVDA